MDLLDWLDLQSQWHKAVFYPSDILAIAEDYYSYLALRGYDYGSATTPANSQANLYEYQQANSRSQVPLRLSNQVALSKLGAFVSGSSANGSFKQDASASERNDLGDGAVTARPFFLPSTEEDLLAEGRYRSARVKIEMVKVGNAGNANDPLSGNVFGGVNHDFQIGKYEVTIQQYTDFLNSVAASDPYQLYNPSMATDARVAGIQRFGISGSYRYAVMLPAGVRPAGADSPGNRPITYIDWFDAARFANWMHNGQVANGTEDGAYTLNGATSGNAVAVNLGARYYLPTESEWYKAAFYSPKLNDGAGGYYLYPTQSNTPPGNLIGPAKGQANFYADSGTYSLTQSPFLVADQNYLTNVGAFSNSPSFYGTFDQGGNAYEWNDLNGLAGPLRSLRSGFFQSNQGDLSVLDRYVAVPVADFSGSGFRLAAPAEDFQPPIISLAGAPIAAFIPASEASGAINLPSTTSISATTATTFTAASAAQAALPALFPVRAMAPVSIEMVTVGNAGNANDPLSGNVFGGVNHDFQIGKYEVTIQQYTDFLNSVAASDPYQLYNPSMATDANVAGVQRFGISGSYRYEVMLPAGVRPAGADSPGNRPITYIDWFDAARFANWMHNGQVANGTEDGAYTLNGATSGNAVAVNPGARYYLPTESEWYKAAFYSPKLNDGAGGYYLYPTQSNTPPGNLIGPAKGQANFYADSGTYSLTQSPFLVADQNYLTNVGAFSNSPSFYGTFDQGGNAYEWNDLNGLAGPLRSLRSGFFQSNQGDLSVLDRYVAVPVADFSGSGFRLAAPVAPPVVTLALAEASVAEDGASDLLYTFTRTGSTAAPLTVKYAVSGSASPGIDYQGIASTPDVLSITFAAGADTTRLRLDPNADRKPEANETISLQLVAGSGYTLGTTLAVNGTILNDDLLGTPASDILVGTAIPEFIDGLEGSDILTGGIGSDVFGFRYGHSTISAPDRITDFQSGSDKICRFSSSSAAALPAPAGFTRASDNATATTLAALVASVFADANGARLGNQPLGADRAALVVATRAPIAGTYLVINDGIASRSNLNDLLIHLSGFSGALPGLGEIPVGLVFA